MDEQELKEAADVTLMMEEKISERVVEALERALVNKGTRLDLMNLLLIALGDAFNTAYAEAAKRTAASILHTIMSDPVAMRSLTREVVNIAEKEMYGTPRSFRNY